MMQLGLFAAPDTVPPASGGYPCDGWQVHSAGVWREGACAPEPGTRIDSDGVARWLIGAAMDPVESGRWLPARLEGSMVMADDGSARAEVDPGFLPALQGQLRIEVATERRVAALSVPAVLRVACWRAGIGGLRLVAVVMALREGQPVEPPEYADSVESVPTVKSSPLPPAEPVDWRKSHIDPKTHYFVLAWTIVSKWLIVQHVEAHIVLSEKVCVCTISSYKAFAVYQSCVHVCWARFSGLHSTMTSTARYLPSRIFATMPRPRPSDGGYALEEMGKLYAEQRYLVVSEMKIEAVKLYNRLADPAEKDPRILALRETHRCMDQMVLDSYGWSDLVAPCLTTVPPCREVGDAPPVFKELTRRLRRLNLDRAREEGTL